ncbi:MAG: nucleoside triphosphate pyrophosphohydrolase [Clostridia bacterium]|nr:nucleoside triphosphate pyrophosphohydrolase [Clostridia bacterium]MDD6040410.1 nucleoside triphosphate pyrophosphohydrolase [Clostridia bacterium]
MKTIYGKLVRDQIPGLIESQGRKCTWKTLSVPEYLAAPDEKLNEELAEYQQDKSLEELADLLEVVRAVIIARGSTIEQVEAICKARAKQRGGFEKQIWLIDTEPAAKKE